MVRLSLLAFMLLLPCVVAGSENVDDKNLPTKGRTPPSSGGRWRTPGGTVSEDLGDLSGSEPPTGMGKKEWARIMSQMQDELSHDTTDSSGAHGSENRNGKEEL